MHWMMRWDFAMKLIHESVKGLHIDDKPNNSNNGLVAP